MSTETRKIALVTGGSRGLGRDMALRLAEKGNDVIVTYHSRRDDAENVAAEIKKLGRKTAIMQLNTGDVKSFGAFFESLKNVLNSEFSAGKFHFLVNNAGHGITVPSFADTTEEQFDHLMNVHFKGVFFLTQGALPLISDGGAIVNISTGLTRFCYPGAGAYASMKSAVETLTRYMARELGHRFIRVNAVAPGAIATDFNGARLRDNANVQEHIKATTALPRIGLADDIGGVVAFLCSDDAKWVNAQRIEVSGGQNI